MVVLSGPAVYKNHRCWFHSLPVLMVLPPCLFILFFFNCTWSTVESQCMQVICTEVFLFASNPLVSFVPSLLRATSCLLDPPVRTRYQGFQGERLPVLLWALPTISNTWRCHKPSDANMNLASLKFIFLSYQGLPETVIKLPVTLSWPLHRCLKEFLVPLIFYVHNSVQKTRKHRGYLRILWYCPRIVKLTWTSQRS